MRFGTLMGLVAMLTAAPAVAAEYRVCQASDGSVYVTDAAGVLPADCRDQRTVTVVATPPEATAPPTPDPRPERAEAVPAATRETIQAESLALRRALADTRLTITYTRDRLHREKFRWAALFPGDWVTRFADPDEVDNLEDQLRLLMVEEARILLKIEALRTDARRAGISPWHIERMLPRDP